MTIRPQSASDKPIEGVKDPSRPKKPPLTAFWERVTEGLQLQQLWQQFRAEARAGYALYSHDVDWEWVEKERGLKRAFKIGLALFWAMLMKLSPARRVALLLALVLSLMGRIAYKMGDVSVSVDIRGWGFLLLFLLLALELADRVTMKRDLEIAREIQQWLVPAAPPAVPGVEIAFATRPANTVAGDYYDAFLRPARDGSAPSGERLLLVVADVAGKSVPAALLMATFQASLRALAAMPTSLEELVAELNRYACAHSLGGLRFTTAFLAELESSARTLTYLNAGHNAPVLRRAAGHRERFAASGLPLGIDPGASYPPGSATLSPGDLLVVFTDGVVEAVNAAGEEFGEQELLRLLDGTSNQSAAEVLRSLLAAVETFARGTRQHDDITCLVLRVV